MSQTTDAVSIYPYFQVHPGKLDAVRPLLARFIAKTETEKNCLWYNFTLDGDVVHCREAYVGAQGVIEHLDNVGALVEEMLTMSDLARLELHGPATELDKLRERCAPLNPAWFVSQCGISR